MNWRFSLLLALMSCGPIAWSADASADYVRYAEDDASSRLEVAIRTFTMPSGQQVDLIGVIHIADLAYYQQLNQRFTGYDAVLFELIGDPRSVTARPPAELQGDRTGGSTLSALQQAASRYLDLTFQLHGIDYTGRNMVHADATVAEFQQMQQERGETMLTLFARAMQTQMSTQMSGRMDVATRELNTFQLIRILMSPDSAAEFKKALARVFDQVENMTLAMEGPGGSAVLSGRNDVVVKKVKEVLGDRKRRRIAVFFGGAHMPGIESALVQQMKAKAGGEEWLAAWTMPKKPMASKQPRVPSVGRESP
jgi:hypothetical protein